MNPFWTTILTVISGVIVFALGQWFQRFVFEPIQAQRKVIGEIAHNLIFLGNLNNVGEHQRLGHPLAYVVEPEEAVKTLRSLGSQIRATLWTIPCYGFFARFGLVPARSAVVKASYGLVGWSNSIYDGKTDPHRTAIADSLGLHEEAPRR